MLTLIIKIQVWFQRLVCEHDWELFKVIEDKNIPFGPSKYSWKYYNEKIYVCPYCGATRRDKIKWKK